MKFKNSLLLMAVVITAVFCLSPTQGPVEKNSAIEALHYNKKSPQYMLG